MERIRERTARLMATMPPVPVEPEAPKCPMCNGMGMVQHDVPLLLDDKSLNPDFGKLHVCPNPDCAEGNRLRARQATARYKSAGLPEEYQALTFASWEAMDADMKDMKWIPLGACRAFAADPQHYVSLEAIYAEARGEDMTYEQFCKALRVEGGEMPRNAMVMYGVPGVGKTGLAAATLNAIAAQGGEVRYIRAMSLFREIRARMDADEYPRDSDVLRDFSQGFKGALVIDEVNIEDYTPARKQWLQDIIRDRIANRLPMILTCNLTREQFEGAWGMWTFAPLHSRAWWLRVRGKNMRPIAPTLEDK